MTVVREHGEADVCDPGGLGRDLAGRMLARGAARLVGAPGSATKGTAAKDTAANGSAIKDTAAKDSATKDSATAGTATTNREDAHD